MKEIIEEISINKFRDYLMEDDSNKKLVIEFNRLVNQYIKNK